MRALLVGLVVAAGAGCGDGGTAGQSVPKLPADLPKGPDQMESNQPGQGKPGPKR